MRHNRIAATLIAGLFAAAPAMPVLAQSGQDTGAGKKSGATTNSGEARPDASGSGSAVGAAPSSKAAPTSGSGGGGSGTARPDASPATSSGAPEANTNSGRAAPTDTRN